MNTLDLTNSGTPDPSSTGHLGSVAAAGSHSVQFYEDDALFLDSLAHLIGSALGRGDTFLLICTSAHHRGLIDLLAERGIDLTQSIRARRLLWRDAERTLATFMVDDWPDERRFFALIEPILLSASLGIGRRLSTNVVAFGEMVALLWADGKCEAAIRLEQLWNLLAHRHIFSLHCAYPMGCFNHEDQTGLFDQVCAEHNHVVPAESFTALQNEDERLRMVSSLQQKAQTLQLAVEDRERQITRRQQVEEQLRRTEEFARQVVENHIDCVMVLDAAGKLEYVSPPGRRALEMTDPSPFLGRNWIDLWKPEDRPRLQTAIDCARSGSQASFEGDCATRGGLIKSWDVRITPSCNGEGAVERLIVVSRDVTELKKAQASVLQSEKLAATGRMAATIAHEINNPLEAVTNCIYLAKNSPNIPADAREHLEIADQELARVAQIAQQTLGFYRDNSANTQVDPADLIRKVVALYHSRLQAKALTTEIRADAAPQVSARHGELKQALSNLISNAIDASTDGGTLWLSARPSRNWSNGLERGIRISIADNGSGISPEIQQQIFLPFFTTKAAVGTGIGLWVTRNLIEKQGGYLRFRSRQGPHAGTVMSFFLPLEPQASSISA